MKSLFKKVKHTGPGGLQCHCCRPLPGSKKENKSFLNRWIRRTFKLDLEN